MTEQERKELERLKSAPSLNEPMRQRLLDLLALAKIDAMPRRGK